MSDWVLAVWIHGRKDEGREREIEEVEGRGLASKSHFRRSSSGVSGP